MGEEASTSSRRDQERGGTTKKQIRYYQLSTLFLLFVLVTVVILFLTLSKDECKDDSVKDECKDDSDCGEAGVCGLSEARKKAPSICCIRTFNNVSHYEQKAIMTVLDDGTSAPVCLDRPAGMFCNDSWQICKSKVCNSEDKICMEGDLEDGQVCTEHRQCSSGACGRLEVKQDAKKVCCTSGRHVDVTFEEASSDGYGDLEPVCTKAPKDSFCRDVDGMCESSACNNDGLCASKQLIVGESCQRNHQCESKACAFHALKNETACCPYSSTFVDPSNGDKRVCARVLSDGEQCQDDQYCNSRICSVEGICLAQGIVGDGNACQRDRQCTSGYCSLAEASLEADTVCCRGSFSIVDFETILDDTRQSVCKDLPVGSLCNGSHEVCATGNCGANNTCIESFSTGEICETNSQCDSGYCGLYGVFSEAPRVCCASGSNRIYDNIVNDYVCTSLPSGTPCAQNDRICASGICINNACTETETKLPVNAICERNEHCQGGACALAVSDVSTAKVCCPSGGSIEGTALGGYASVCTQMPLGTFCHQIPGMCLSGLCLKGGCSDSLLGDDQECNASAECQSQACGLSSANATDASYICCSSGSVFHGEVDSVAWQGNHQAVCTDRPAGTYCKNLDSVCASGSCQDGFCT